MIVFRFTTWNELKKILDLIRYEVEISSTKITQIMKSPGKCSNEELIKIANRLGVYPAELLEFGLGEDRISEVEKDYHQRFFNQSKHYDQSKSPQPKKANSSAPSG